MAHVLEVQGWQTARNAPPALLGGAARGAAGAAEDRLLPGGFLEVRETVLLGPTARDAAAAQPVRAMQADEGEVLLLELEDGSTLVTSAAQLRASLLRSRPDLVEGDRIRLDRLNEASAAPSRGMAADLGKAVVKRVLRAVLHGDLAGDALLQGAGVDAAVLGLSWAGTRALMRAVENQVVANEGLCAWGTADGGVGAPTPVAADHFKDYQGEPLLVFVHGTASSTVGSFGELQGGDRDLWAALRKAHPGGIYALEHRTLSQSPIENAIALARALPRGARVRLVSHSRGGLVADLLCLRDFGALIEQYRRDPGHFQGAGSAEGERALPPGRTLADELDQAHAEQRALLTELAALLADRQLTVERYVRVAAPANGTRLAGGNFDLFLSSILSLLGLSPWFFGNPLYSAFKRVVLEIAQRRTDPHMVPGIEAMLPDSPLARLLRQAPVQADVAVGLIAGDAEGGSALSRLGVLLTDFLFFDQVDNDLVVDTPAMLAGIAARAGARALLERSAATTHFRYFANLDTRTALRDWLTSTDPRALPAFVELPQDDAALQEKLQRALEGRTRDAGAAADLPVVVLLPGIMGSTLRAGGDRIWMDPLRLLRGGLDRVAWGREGVEADSLLALSYGDLAEELSRTHRVVAFAYDWRQPLDVLGERLGALLAQLLQQTKQPLRLLAHSMGGLVVRGCIYRRRAVMDELMARDGARLVMLGTPHQGSHTMVQNLLGKGGMLRALAAMDTRHSLEELLGIVAGFRGALQLLPRPGFVDDFQTEAQARERNFLLSATWDALKPSVKDFWFGDGRMAVPAQDALDQGGWLWSQDNGSAVAPTPPSLPAEYTAKAIYVFGVALNTACGVVVENGRLKLQGTPRGDGTVTWASGRIGNVGLHYYMPAEHGNLCDTREHFGALVELLVKGSTMALAQTPPASRAAQPQAPLVYDAGPPAVLSDAALASAAVGGKSRTRIKPRPKRRLEVGVTATDLRFLTQPVLVGHYENDPIAGPEALIDRELLDGDLSHRLALGLYAGARGTATAALRVSPLRPLGPGMVRGAVVTGLGRYEQPLSGADLTEAVRAGVLRLLLQLADQLGPELADAEVELPLATLLLGYNSNANLSVDSSVEALVRGVLEANARFHEGTRLRLRVGRLDIVELYLDTAITAVYALRRMAQEGSRLSRLAQSQGTALVCRRTLRQGQGLRQRLFDNHASAYWPRLMITSADLPAATPAAVAGVTAAPRAAAIANRLRFVYVGQRARAETEMQQRQPGLVEALIRQQIASPVWNEDIGRMLFQLMVPHDFKEAGRQLQRVVLVLDEYTANMPWELMFAADAQPGAGAEAGHRPMALQVPMVRQLASADYRRQVRPSVGRTALVVGNPSVAGFELSFLAGGRPALPLPPLDGAEAEANAVVQVLTGLGYTVQAAIGPDQRAVDVMAQLLRQPWRLLHIAAHGVFDLEHTDGGRRSGVVLSDGLLITAAEIAAMEWVPELVFLSCCHLGQVDGGAQRLRDANKLAASVARELMRIGVRCVVVAGWAVNDGLAREFGTTFYKELLLNRQPFGEAVFRARQAIYQEGGGDITWGAYQAYGDADWRAEGLLQAPAAGDGDSLVASPDELLDELASRRAALARRATALTEAELKRQRVEIQALLDGRCPPDWRQSPPLQSALGATWGELGDFSEAHKAYLCAVQAEDQLGRVPIRDIEQLSNVEARLGEKLGDESLIRRALQRLRDLDRLVGEAEAGRPGANAERCALRGGALKRLAGVHARALLEQAHPPNQAGAQLEEALTKSAQAYREGEGLAGQPGFRPYNALNGLALQALLFKARAPVQPPQDALDWPAQALELARLSEAEARRAFAVEADTWTALMPLEARLVQALLEGALDQGEPAAAARNRLLQDFRAELQRLVIKPRELDSVLGHLCQLSRLADALFLHSGVAALWHVGTHLLGLAQGLGATGHRRADKVMARAPADVGGGEAPASTADATAAGKGRGRKTAAGRTRTGAARGK